MTTSNPFFNRLPSIVSRLPILPMPAVRFTLHVLFRFFFVYRLPSSVYRTPCHSERSEESQISFIFPLTPTLSPHFIRRPSVPPRERELYYFRFTLHAVRSSLSAVRFTLHDTQDSSTHSLTNLFSLLSL